ncbi:MAG: hypothetical protein QNJ14_15915 [Woeseiaceae bacterium]|nr:hypothetical protein [Woeseiaceae bacterium]
MLLVEDNDEIEGAWHSDRIVPYFNFIPGSIFGTPDEVPFMPVTVDANLEFTARLSEWTMAADAAAEPLTDWNRENGLRIEPEETRVLRVGTFAHDTLHDESLGGSLVEIGREGYVVFIYVDRPCAITGDLITGGTTFSHEIYLGADGFHFIGLDGDDFLYAIKPENQLLFVTSH